MAARDLLAAMEGIWKIWRILRGREPMAKKKNSLPPPPPGGQQPSGIRFDLEDLLAAAITSVVIKRPRNRRKTAKRDHQR
jgi:hypothetical protein